MINYPIYLTNMNRLTTTKNMVEKLFELNSKANITIIDNSSTYSPLLDWYEKVQNDINIIKHKTNLGPWTFFRSGYWKKCKENFYCYSDADLELNPNMPYNWQEIMFEYHKKYEAKASLVLRLDDIPRNHLYDKINKHQSNSWNKTDEKNIYTGITDMTFSFDAKNCGYRYKSVRLGGNFACRHIPWYLDPNNISEEEKYYLSHIDSKKFHLALWSRLNQEKIKEKI